MNTPKRHGTFISYSRRDKEFALELARELRAAGCLVWLDQLDIPTGARWDDEVEKALREHEIFLIILTPASVSSENVKDEIGYAIDHAKRIMPVLLEQCDVPLRLRRFQHVDFTKIEFSEGIRRAKQLLEDLLNEQFKPVEAISPELERQKASDREAKPAHPLPKIANYKPMSQSTAIITDRDGTQTTIPADTLRWCINSGEAISLDNGYTITLDTIKLIDIVRATPAGGKTVFAITLLDGATTEGETFTCSFIGQTSLGRFELWTDRIQSIEILR